jgi:hypothetical protein
MEILSGGKLNVCIHSNGVLVVELKKKMETGCFPLLSFGVFSSSLEADHTLQNSLL